MKVLLVLAHYFRAEEDSSHSSTDPGGREPRRRALEQVVQSWRGHLGIAAQLNIERRAYEPVQGMEDALDIVVLVRGEDHLLDKALRDRYRLKVVDVAVDNPRLIPFGSRRVFAETRNAYDLFVYSEDDLRPADGGLLSKIAGFVETFGWRRVALPNRYEWNPGGPALKTFIDGDLKAALMSRYLEALPDEPFLRQRTPGREILFRRATNPHAGFFALTPEQLAHWIEQPHYNDFDCAFVGPLESAATLGILKTFPIYKSFARDSGWLEIQHLDLRFSSMRRRPPSAVAKQDSES